MHRIMAGCQYMHHQHKNSWTALKSRIMMTSSNGNIFPRYCPFVRRIHRSPVNSSHKGQWRGALMFSLICAWRNGWVNDREAGNLRRHHAHYGITVMCHHANFVVAGENLRLCLCHIQPRALEQFLTPVRFLVVRPSEEPVGILRRCCSYGHIMLRALYWLARIHT